MDLAGRRAGGRATGAATFGFVVAIVVTVLALQVIALVAVGVSADRDANAQATAVYELVSEVNVDRIQEHVRPTQAQLSVAYDAVADGEFTVAPGAAFEDDLAARELAVIDIIRPHQQLTTVEIALADGTYYVATRRPQGGYFVVSSPGPGEPTYQILYGSELDVTVERTEGSPVPDQRDESWYMAGVFSSTPVWVDPGAPVTAGGPMPYRLVRAVRRDSETVGAVAIGIAPRSLGPTLTSLQFASSDRAYLLTTDADLVAIPEDDDAPVNPSPAPGEPAGPRPLGDRDDYGITLTATALAGELPESDAVVEREGGHLRLDRRVSVGWGLDWVLHMEGEVSDIVPGVTNYRRTMLWSMALITATVLLAAFVLWRLRRPLRDLHTRAATDQLTGVANRHEFSVAGPGVLDAAHARGLKAAVIVLDVDHFKAINDEYGHDAGDRALVAIADALAEHCGPRDLLARLGGDEFAVIRRLEGGDDPGDVVERLRVAAAAPLAARYGGTLANLSAGYVVSTIEGPALDRLLRRADAALVAGRRRGKGATYGG